MGWRGSAKLQPAWKCHKYPRERFLVKKISGFFFLFIVTHFSTQTQSHMRSHTHTLTRTHTHTQTKCRHFGLFVVQTGCYTLRPETLVSEIRRTNMHTLLIYNYLQICKTQVKFASSSFSLLLRPLLLLSLSGGLRGGSGWRSRLVDPRQLLHNLNDLIHCGFTFHAAAIIDL